MATELAYFDLDELVCKEVYDKYGDKAWSFFDPRLFDTIEWIREKLNKPMFVNNWKSGGQFDERGLRCNLCSLVKKATLSQQLYLSPHIRGQAIDFDVQGMLAEEVRQWIIARKNFMPHKIRMEKNVNWVHIDIANDSIDRLILFNP